MTFGSLFAGIGGFDLGLTRSGMTCKWQVEIDNYCLAVLKKHWPDVPKFRDIHDCGKHNLEPVDLICGGWPCQPFSVAGKRRGKEDDRYLWPEVSRILQEIRPPWFLGENVPGIIPMELDTVLSDLESQGYETVTFSIPACAVDAPHRRDRVWIVAYPSQRKDDGRKRGDPDITTTGGKSGNSAVILSGQDVAHTQDPNGWRTNTKEHSGRWNPQIRGCDFAERGIQYWLPEPNVGRVAHGVPSRVDRLKALGNTVVPQVSEEIGRIIMQANQALQQRR